jgi:hypothetical protein
MLSNPFYEINLPISDPLNLEVDELYKKAKFIHTGMAIMSKEYLKVELIETLAFANIDLKDFVVWNWDKTKNYRVHTDGDYFSDKKRLCGINWNFTPTTSVKFFDSENGRPFSRGTSEIDFSTYWLFQGDPRVISEWSGFGPVIFNPQIPHQVSFNDYDTRFRRSITLRFRETFSSLYEKLKGKNYV